MICSDEGHGNPSLQHFSQNQSLQRIARERCYLFAAGWSGDPKLFGSVLEDCGGRMHWKTDEECSSVQYIVFTTE